MRLLCGFLTLRGHHQRSAAEWDEGRRPRGQKRTRRTTHRILNDPISKEIDYSRATEWCGNAWYS
eukprot:2417968-Amphidinium_carterae.1